MSLYLDTSVWISALVQETETPRVQAWLSVRTGQPLTLSDWTSTEVSSALAQKVRTRALAAEDHPAALSAWGGIVARVGAVSLNRGHFLSAARLCERYDLGLRGGDALHLAIVLARGDTLCTRDRRFAAAAEAYGADIELV